jgi:UDP-N-acetylglucosamine 2-epimerase (non-hydrolysing)
VDEPGYLADLLRALAEIARRLPVVFPMHPRTTRRIAEFGLEGIISQNDALIASDSLGYLDFIGVLSDARLAITDSGGIQEETTALGVPCFTVRDRTERPVTVSSGSNIVVGRDPARLVEEVDSAMSGPTSPARLPDGWDGRAGERIVAHLRADLKSRASSTADHLHASTAHRREGRSAAGTR